MANCQTVSKTNYFRVTDEEKYKELISHLYTDSGDPVDYFSYIDANGISRFGFGAYGTISYAENSEEEEERSIDKFLAKIQEILPEDESFILFEVGNEKLRSVFGYAVVCTQDKIETIDLESCAAVMAGDMLGIENFALDM